MKESSVSPERWETMTPQPFCIDMFAASIASVMDPIWFTFRSKALHAPTSKAFSMRLVLVTNKSSPTIWTSLPHFLLNSA
eukprot:Skav220410  [mRNA]  locus=scaffold639:472101:475266:+ [translate_table: standard]